MKVNSYGMEMFNAAKLNQNIEKDMESSQDKELMDSCVKLEGEFMKIMLKEMKKTIPDSGFMPKSAGHDIMEDMYYETIGEDAAQNSSTGLAKMIYDQFTRSRTDKK